MFWRKKFTLDKFLKEYEHAKGNSLTRLMDTFPQGIHNHKTELLNLIEAKIEGKDASKLDLYLALAWRDGLDDSYKSSLKKLVLAKWHNYHEDIIDYIGDLKDDSFTEDIYTVATHPFYRQYDDENESTLRKCVHALKAINSENANLKIALLTDTGNINVKYALEMYN